MGLVVRFAALYLRTPGTQAGTLLVEPLDAGVVLRWRDYHGLAAARPRRDPDSGRLRLAFPLGEEAVRRVEAGGLRDGAHAYCCYIASARSGQTRAELVAVAPIEPEINFADE